MKPILKAGQVVYLITKFGLVKAEVKSSDIDGVFRVVADSTYELVDKFGRYWLGTDASGVITHGTRCVSHLPYEIEHETPPPLQHYYNVGDKVAVRVKDQLSFQAGVVTFVFTAAYRNIAYRVVTAEDLQEVDTDRAVGNLYINSDTIPFDEYLKLLQ